MPQATILVVDDEPLNLQALVRVLGTGYRVRAANTGDSALQAVGAEIPDLILLDVMMPGTDGHEVLRRLREQPATREVPVIFLTALAGADDEETGLSLGAADYIPSRSSRASCSRGCAPSSKPSWRATGYATRTRRSKPRWIDAWPRTT